MRKLIVVLAALAATVAAPAAFPADAGGPTPAQFKIMHSDRTELGDDLAHYRYDVAMGTGKYDVVRIHRSSGRNDRTSPSARGTP